MKNSTISPSGTLLPIERNFTIGRQIPWKSYLKQTDKTPGHKKIFPLCLAAEICSRIKTFLAAQTPLPIPRIEKLCCCNASLQLVRCGFPRPSGFKLCGSTILTRDLPPSALADTIHSCRSFCNTASYQGSCIYNWNLTLWRGVRKVISGLSTKQQI